VDLLITDEAMPQMRGSQLAEIVQAELPALPIVLATGYADLRLPEGVVLPLPRVEKPFSQADLAVAIQKVMSRQSS